MAGIQTPQRRLLAALRGHLLDRKRLAWDTAIAKPSARPFVFGRAFIVASRRIIHAGSSGSVQHAN
jgi:hypothetical protein